ncbi:MAG: YdaS family helix-turn-helix protein [Pseudomonadota bacterium]
MEQQPTQFEALTEAVARAGSQEKFAAICGVSQPAVWKWLQVSKRLPPEHVLQVETATEVSRHHLRPDIYPIVDASKLPAFTRTPARAPRRHTSNRPSIVASA